MEVSPYDFFPRLSQCKIHRKYSKILVFEYQNKEHGYYVIVCYGFLLVFYSRRMGYSPAAALTVRNAE